MWDLARDEEALLNLAFQPVIVPWTWQEMLRGRVRRSGDVQTEKSVVHCKKLSLFSKSFFSRSKLAVGATFTCGFGKYHRLSIWCGIWRCYIPISIAFVERCVIWSCAKNSVSWEVNERLDKSNFKLRKYHKRWKMGAVERADRDQKSPIMKFILVPERSQETLLSVNPSWCRLVR